MNTAVVLQYSKLWSDLKFFFVKECARATSLAHFSCIAAHFSPASLLPRRKPSHHLSWLRPDSGSNEQARRSPVVPGFNRCAARPSSWSAARRPSPTSTGTPPTRHLDLPPARRLDPPTLGARIGRSPTPPVIQWRCCHPRPLPSPQIPRSAKEVCLLAIFHSSCLRNACFFVSILIVVLRPLIRL
jgi:hypothetical protein